MSELLQTAYLKLTQNGNFEAIHEVDEEYASSTIFTGSGTDKLLSDKTSSVLNKAQLKNFSNPNSTPKNLNIVSSLDERLISGIAPFDAGQRHSIQNRPSFDNGKEEKPISKTICESAHQKTINIKLFAPVSSYENKKFSFKKPVVDRSQDKQISNPNIYIMTEDSRVSKIQNTLSKENSEIKELSKTKEEYPNKKTNEQVNWNFSKLKKMCKSSKISQSEKYQTHRDKSNTHLHPSLSYCSRSNVNYKKLSDEVKQTIDRYIYNPHPHNLENDSIIWLDKSKECLKRNSSVNSRTSRGSYESGISASRIKSDASNRSQLDQQQAPKTGSKPSIFRHKNI